MTEERVDERALMRGPTGWIAFGFGSGLSPVAPGTCGTLVAIPCYLALAMLPWPAYVAAVVASFALGVWASDRVVRALERDDPQAVVVDEMVGYWITMMPVLALHWPWLVLGFILFRLFDILKPWPIRGLDREVGGGLGAMLDDALAGVYAAAVMAAMAWWLGHYQ